MGEWNTATDPDCGEDPDDCYDRVQDIDVAKIVQHENFINTKTEVHNDIALLRLARKVVYSDTVVPICLPLDGSFASRPYDSLKMFVAGWGQTEDGECIVGVGQMESGQENMLYLFFLNGEFWYFVSQKL